MRWFKNMKIGLEPQGGFALVASIAAVVGWVGLSAVGKVDENSHAMYGGQLVPIRDLAYANAAVLDARHDAH